MTGSNQHSIATLRVHLNNRKWNTGPDAQTQAASAALDSLEEQLQALEGRVQAALLELGRASDVRTNRTGIIGNVDLILRGSNPARESDA